MQMSNFGLINKLDNVNFGFFVAYPFFRLCRSLFLTTKFEFVWTLKCSTNGRKSVQTFIVRIQWIQSMVFLLATYFWFSLSNSTTVCNFLFLPTSFYLLINSHAIQKVFVWFFPLCANWTLICHWRCSLCLDNFFSIFSSLSMHFIRLSSLFCLIFAF